MRLQDLLIGLLIFSLFMTILIGFSFSMYAKMGVAIDNSTQSIMRSFEVNANKTGRDMYGDVIVMQNQSIGGSGASTDTSKTYSENLLTSGVRVLTTAANSFKMLQDTMGVLGAGLHIPWVIIATLLSIVILIVIILFASSILQNRL